MHINFLAKGIVPPETVERNSALSKHYPPPDSLAGAHLAVAASGPSLNDHIGELRQWSGPIWAINGTAKQLRDLGIDNWFFATDPQPLVAPLAVGASKAILGGACDPSVFEALAGADVRRFDLLAMARGPTAATCVPYLAVTLGAREVSFFGCESSYRGTTHSYSNQLSDHRLEVECNGERFYTKVELLMQAQFLGEFMRLAPTVYYDRSGGLLRAMTKTPVYDVLAATQFVHDEIARQAGCQPTARAI